MALRCVASGTFAPKDCPLELPLYQFEGRTRGNEFTGVHECVRGMQYCGTCKRLSRHGWMPVHVPVESVARGHTEVHFPAQEYMV